jgi:diguanylate cyclase
MLITELTIDKGFITEIEAYRGSQVIVRPPVTLALQLGLTTVAGCVENLAICSRLRSIGVDQIQGFGVARPMPPNEIGSWLEDRSDRCLL